MKITLFEQAPYRYLPEGFEHANESVCSTPYSLTTREGVYSSIRDFMDELLHGARAGFDGIAVTEHGCWRPNDTWRWTCSAPARGSTCGGSSGSTATSASSTSGRPTSCTTSSGRCRCSPS